MKLNRNKRMILIVEKITIQDGFFRCGYWFKHRNRFIDLFVVRRYDIRKKRIVDTLSIQMYSQEGAENIAHNLYINNGYTGYETQSFE